MPTHDPIADAAARLERRAPGATWWDAGWFDARGLVYRSGDYRPGAAARAIRDGARAWYAGRPDAVAIVEWCDGDGWHVAADILPGVYGPSRGEMGA